MKKGKWTFLTNHGRVLVYIAKHPQSTTQKTADKIGVTLRTVQKIILDLEIDGYLARQKNGRNNTYTIDPKMPLRHRLERDHIVGDILDALGADNQSKRVRQRE
jgi:predicted ArsR family transcriptional regulator